MHIRDTLIVHLCSLAEEVVDSPIHHFLIARHRCRGKNNRILGLYSHKSMVLICYASESRSWFTLAACTNDYHALRRKFVYVLRTYEHGLWYVQIPKVNRHLHIIDHTAPNKCNHPFIAGGSINNLLHA